MQGARRYVYTIVLILAVISGVVFWRESDKVLEIKGRQLTVDIADNDIVRQRGLSGRKNLADDRGMLFIFNDDGFHGIWMKDMLISIDVLWLDHSGRVVHAENNLAPSTYPTVFRPSQQARYVLELNETAIERLGIKAGDMIMGLE